MGIERRLAVALTAVCLLPGIAVRAAGQAVLLQIRPHIGDTLHMRLDQEMDLAGNMVQGDGEMWTTMTTTWCVLQRMVVQRADSSGADVLQLTDSMAVSTSLPDAMRAPTGRSADGQGSGGQPLERAVLLHIASDGAVTVANATDRVGKTLRQVLANLPVTFPRHPVTVGSSWTRTMQLPPGAEYGADSIRLQFRLDSLSPTRDSAFISVHGPLAKQRPQIVAGGSTRLTQGNLTGMLLIDLRRGWPTEWHAVISVQSILRPPKGADTASGRMHMTVMQWLRAVDRP
jgi:hypothetical protein